VDASAPDDGVIVDVVFEGGVLYLELANLSDRPAFQITCEFDPAVEDAQGRDVSELALFRQVEFLAPGRRIRTLLDSSAGYFARESPTRLTVAVTYERAEGERRTTQLTHDLEIFRELAYLA
jgi:hypothetical protein